MIAARMVVAASCRFHELALIVGHPADIAAGKTIVAQMTAPAADCHLLMVPAPRVPAVPTGWLDDQGGQPLSSRHGRIIRSNHRG